MKISSKCNVENEKSFLFTKNPVLIELQFFIIVYHSISHQHLQTCKVYYGIVMVVVVLCSTVLKLTALYFTKMLTKLLNVSQMFQICFLHIFYMISIFAIICSRIPQVVLSENPFSNLKEKKIKIIPNSFKNFWANFLLFLCKNMSENLVKT